MKTSCIDVTTKAKKHSFSQISYKCLLFHQETIILVIECIPNNLDSGINLNDSVNENKCGNKSMPNT